jgi:hypothetical protein
MPSRGGGSRLPLLYGGRPPAFAQDNEGGTVGAKAVGKPDKTTSPHPIRGLFCAPKTITRMAQSRLQTALLRLNSPNIAKLQTQYGVCRQMKWRICKYFADGGWSVPSIWGRRHHARFLFPYRHLTCGDESYRGALRSLSGDFSFPRSEFRTTET